MKTTIGINEQGYRVAQWNQAAKYSDREIQLIRELRVGGMTYRAISEKMDMSYHTVLRVCRYERRAEIPATFKDCRRSGNHGVRRVVVTKKMIRRMCEYFNEGNTTTKQIASRMGVDESLVKKHVLNQEPCLELDEPEAMLMETIKLFHTLPDDAVISTATFACLLDEKIRSVLTRSKSNKNFPSPIKLDGGPYRYRVGDVRRYMSTGSCTQKPFEEPVKRQNTVATRKAPRVPTEQIPLFSEESLEKVEA